LLKPILVRGWHNDFSFGGVEEQLLENYEVILFGALSPKSWRLRSGCW
jgi:hypothetical protein